MHADYVDEEHARREGIEPGWYIYDQDGNRIDGPFRSQEEAERRIEELTPPPPRRPSRGFER